MAQRPNFRGYAKLSPYQYHTFGQAPVQYSTVPLYAAPPVHPHLEPPTDHPVEKEEEEPVKDAEESPTESTDSPGGNISHPQATKGPQLNQSDR